MLVNSSIFLCWITNITSWIWSWCARSRFKRSVRDDNLGMLSLNTCVWMLSTVFLMFALFSGFLCWRTTSLKLISPQLLTMKLLQISNRQILHIILSNVGRRNQNRPEICANVGAYKLPYGCRRGVINIVSCGASHPSRIPYSTM